MGETLDVADVRLLLLGLPSVKEEEAPSAAPVKVRASRLSRCTRCHWAGLGLWTFQCKTDWEGFFYDSQLVNKAVAELRRETGRHTILLCDWCIDEIGC